MSHFLSGKGASLILIVFTIMHWMIIRVRVVLGKAMGSHRAPGVGQQSLKPKAPPEQEASWDSAQSLHHLASAWHADTQESVIELN